MIARHLHHLREPGLWLLVAIPLLLTLTHSHCPVYYRTEETLNEIRLLSSIQSLLFHSIFVVCALLALLVSWHRHRHSMTAGLFIFISLLLLLIFSPMLAHRALYQVTVTDNRISVQNGLIPWGNGTVTPDELSHVELFHYRVKGISKHYPVLVRQDGSKVRLGRYHSAEQRALAELYRRWHVPADPVPGVHDYFLETHPIEGNCRMRFQKWLG